MLLAGIIGAKLGWMWIFYIEGGASALWLLFWFFLAEDSPATQKRINPEEREFIMQSLNQTEGESSSGQEVRKYGKY